MRMDVVVVEKGVGNERWEEVERGGESSVV